jgi:hypothetical protein
MEQKLALPSSEEMGAATVRQTTFGQMTVGQKNLILKSQQKLLPLQVDCYVIFIINIRNDISTNAQTLNITSTMFVI